MTIRREDGKVARRILIALGAAWLLCAWDVKIGFSQANPWPDKSASQAEWDAYHRRQEQILKKYKTPPGRHGSHEWRKQGLHNGNQIVTLFYNYGSIGKPRTEPSLQWPKGSGHGYGFEFGILVAGEVRDIQGFRRHIVSDGLDVGGDRAPDGLPWGWEPLPGYADSAQEFIAMSDRPSTWPPYWPNKGPEWAGKWIGEYGLGVVTADQESYYVMDDYWNREFAFIPDPVNDPDRRGLGVQVEVRGYQWTHTLAQDCIFWVYEMENVGIDTLPRVYLGMYGDPHVGGADDYSDDDGYYDTKLDMVFAWDHDFRGEHTGWRPGYLGYKFLESPGEPYDGKDNDEDGIVDESMQDDIDNDGDWNPVVDDVGADGLGPNDPDYPGPDKGEGDGVPTHGEPNFDETDLDEADQIGLTTFSVFEYGSVWASQDEDIWRMMASGIVDSLFDQTTDNIFMYASGPIKVAPHDLRRFSIALLFGYDEADLFRTAKIVQKIYNAGYRFAKAPLKPHLTAVPGDRRVTLYWDDIAEYSRDPVHGYDFEGYAIYRGTDVGFNDALVITDAQGNPKLWKPIAQFDLKDGIKGPHKVEQANGIHYYMGDDTGLRHSFVDTNVVNGQTYYYAVVAYDKGDTVEIPPTECAKAFIEDPPNSGHYVPDVNTAIVTPQAPSAGYVPARVFGGQLAHQGPGTGRVLVEIIDPRQVRDGHTYEIIFEGTWPAKVTYSLRDTDEVVVDTLSVNTRYYYTAWDSSVFPPVPIDSVLVARLNPTKKNLIASSVVVRGLRDGRTYERGLHFQPDEEKNWILLNTDFMPVDQRYVVEYRRYLFRNSPYLDGSDLNPYEHGLKVTVVDDPLEPDQARSRWLRGSCNFRYVVQKYPGGGVAYPADYEIHMVNRVVKSYNNRPARFVVLNVTRGDTVDFVFFDTDADSTISPQDKVVPLERGIQSKPVGTWQVFFLAPSDSIVYDPLGNPVDTIRVQWKKPQPGDVFLIASKKPFSGLDRFTFRMEGPKVDRQRARSELDRIAVVPNPYVAAAEWEPKPDVRSGRGERRIYFIHLPAQCTIRIYTMSGELVRTIHHSSPIDDGAEPWNLLSQSGMDIAYGVYLYHVEAPGIGEKIGKFAIIK